MKSASAGEPTPGSLADACEPADPVAIARTIVLRKLAAAPRTRQQLADVLRQKQVPETAAEFVLDRFTEVGLIDDGEYACMWVRSRQATKAIARPLLRRELRQRGVSDELIAAALQQVSDEDETSRAIDLVRRKLAASDRLAPEVRYRRLSGLLARKGYSAAVIATVVRQVLSESPDAGLSDLHDVQISGMI